MMEIGQSIVLVVFAYFVHISYQQYLATFKVNEKDRPIKEVADTLHVSFQNQLETQKETYIKELENIKKELESNKGIIATKNNHITLINKEFHDLRRNYSVLQKEILYLKELLHQNKQDLSELELANSQMMKHFQKVGKLRNGTTRNPSLRKIGTPRLKSSRPTSRYSKGDDNKSDGAGISPIEEQTDLTTSESIMSSKKSMLKSDYSNTSDNAKSEEEANTVSNITSSNKIPDLVPSINNQTDVKKSETFSEKNDEDEIPLKLTPESNTISNNPATSANKTQPLDTINNIMKLSEPRIVKKKSSSKFSNGMRKISLSTNMENASFDSDIYSFASNIIVQDNDFITNANPPSPVGRMLNGKPINPKQAPIKFSDHLDRKLKTHKDISGNINTFNDNESDIVYSRNVKNKPSNLTDASHNVTPRGKFLDIGGTTIDDDNADMSLNFSASSDPTVRKAESLSIHDSLMNSDADYNISNSPTFKVTYLNKRKSAFFKQFKGSSSDADLSNILAPARKASSESSGSVSVFGRIKKKH